jgi:MSHA biogenesis protein MshQ
MTARIKHAMARFFLPSLIFALLGAMSQAYAIPIKLEAATISVTGVKPSGTSAGGDLTRDWTRVNFTQSFTRIPYVFTVPTKQGGNAGAHRIRNVSTTGFYIRSVEPYTFDGAHLGMQVTYLAVEACESGQSQCEVSVPLSSGGVEHWMIGHVDTTRWVGWGRDADNSAYWESIGFSSPSPFSVTPAVLAQVQSIANETGVKKTLPQSHPWLTSAVENIGSSGFSVALERSEATDQDSVTTSERIAWIAAPPGGRKNLLDANGQPVGYEIIRSGASIKGWDNGSTFINFAQAWAVNPQVIGSLNSRDNREPASGNGSKGDGGWLRRDSGDTQLKTRTGFVIDETHHTNKGQDNNRTKNVGEVAGIFAFERAFSIDPIALDHYRIVLDGAGQTCSPEPITLKACADSNCTSLYAGAVTLGLSPDASDANATWSGTGVSGDSVSFSSGQASINLIYGKAATISLDAVGTPIAPHDTQCEINGVVGSCSFVVSQCTIRPFEACDVTTSPCTESGTNLFTKVSGNGSVVLNLIKILPSGTNKGKVDTSYATSASKTVSVDLVTGSAALDAATGCPTGAAQVAGSATGNLTFASGRANTVTVLPAASNTKAVKDVRLRFTQTLNGSQSVSCATDSFTIRSADLVITGPALASSKTRPGATGDSAAAGAAFILEAQARTATGATSTGYSGTPVLDASAVESCMAASDVSDSGACPGSLASDRLAGSFSSAESSTGKASGSFTYDDAGAFQLLEDAFVDSGFAAGDAGNQGCVVGDTSNIAGSDDTEADYGKVGCSIGSAASGAGSQAQFGRFYPAHFLLGSSAFHAACGAYSYFGQPFGLDANISARNQDNTKTLTRYPGGGLELAAARAAAATTNLSPTSVFSGDAAPTWANGATAVAWTQVQYAKAATLQAPIADLHIGLRVSDADDRPMHSPDLLTNYKQLAGFVPELRFGRLRLSYATGSELLTLPMSLTAQYWNGQVFVTNTNDNCTSITTALTTAATAELNDPGLHYAVTASTVTPNNKLYSGLVTEPVINNPPTINNGVFNLRLNAPGKDNFGYLDLTIPAPAWLQYNWDGIDQPLVSPDGNLFDDNPRARAAFGKSKVQRKGADKVIIRREIY